MTDHDSAGLAVQIAAALRDIPDFPEPGVVFKDITPLLHDAALRARVVAALSEAGEDIDLVAGLEARGFIFGAAVAEHLGVGFVPIRKAGKLPWKTHAVSYDLEYGSATLEVHQDALTEGQRVLVVDDVLATGGTAAAACQLIDRCGAEVAGLAVVLELGFLDGRTALGGRPLTALLTT